MGKKGKKSRGRVRTSARKEQRGKEDEKRKGAGGRKRSQERKTE